MENRLSKIEVLQTLKFENKRWNKDKNQLTAEYSYVKGLVMQISYFLDYYVLTSQPDTLVIILSISSLSTPLL